MLTYWSLLVFFVSCWLSDQKDLVTLRATGTCPLSCAIHTPTATWRDRRPRGPGPQLCSLCRVRGPGSDTRAKCGRPRALLTVRTRHEKLRVSVPVSPPRPRAGARPPREVAPCRARMVAVFSAACSPVPTTPAPRGPARRAPSSALFRPHGFGQAHGHCHRSRKPVSQQRMAAPWVWARFPDCLPQRLSGPGTDPDAQPGEQGRRPGATWGQSPAASPGRS